MAHLALYRKYRPTSFPELVGQAAVSRTLSRALEQDRLAHAYLFCGPRGTGKTSVARILARGINCAQGPTPTPCGQCPSCLAISEGRHLDVVEIDAASHNGVDHVRELQDRVALAPAQGRRKIYIVDEVHMLSTGAFNALLKTLEEPPAHVVFVLATTDPHKVLPTIVSRCQRFDFGRIAPAELVGRLRWVLEAEGLGAEPEALEAIAQRAQGGLRDALSLLDQVVAVAGGTHLGMEEVGAALGLADARQVARLALAVLHLDAGAALAIAHQLQAAGQEPATLLRELATAIRHALVLAISPDQAQALEVPLVLQEAWAAQPTPLSLPEGAWLVELLQEAEQLIRRSNQAGPWLDLCLIRLCGRPPMEGWRQLEARVAALEQGAPAARPAPRGASLAPVGPLAQAPFLAPGPGPLPPPAADPPPAPPSGGEGRGATSPAQEGAPSPSDPGGAAAREASPPDAGPREPAPASSGPPAPPAHGAGAGSLEAHWAQVLALITAENKATGSLLAQQASPVRLEEGRLILRLGKVFQQMFERKADKRAQLSGALAQVFGEALHAEPNHRFEHGDAPVVPPAEVRGSAPPSPPGQLSSQRPAREAPPEALPPAPPRPPTPEPGLEVAPPSAPARPASPRSGQLEAEASKGQVAAGDLGGKAPSLPELGLGSVGAGGELPASGGDEVLRLAVQHFKGRVRRR